MDWDFSIGSMGLVKKAPTEPGKAQPPAKPFEALSFKERMQLCDAAAKLKPRKR